jgi:hypothetical protein
MPRIPLPLPSRYHARHAARIPLVKTIRSGGNGLRPAVLGGISIFLAGLLIGVILDVGVNPNPKSAASPTPATAQATSGITATLATCHQASRNAKALAQDAAVLADAANRHAELMRRLDLYLAHKPGGLSPHDALALGMSDVVTFRKYGPGVYTAGKDLPRYSC